MECHNLPSQRPLYDLVGKRVQYVGSIGTWRAADGGIHLLLKNIKLSPFDPKDVRYVDHLWQASTKSLNPDFRRFDEIVGVGEVYQYFRCDGTLDYGIKPVAAMSLKESSERINRAKPLQKTNPAAFYGVVAEELEYVLCALRDRCLVIDFRDDIALLEKQLLQDIDFAIRQRDINLKYQSKAKKPLRQSKVKEPGWAIRLY